MSRDRGRHREIREKILKELSEKGLKEVWSSHSGGKIVDFVTGFGDKTVHLSEPDIVVFHAGRILIIEIELGSEPKDLLGVAFANAISAKGRYGDSDFKNLDRKSLLIVLDSHGDKSTDPSSGKKPQRGVLKEGIENKLDFEWVDIVLDDKASSAIDRWLERVKGYHFFNL
jgi:hypothetical protein